MNVLLWPSLPPLMSNYASLLQLKKRKTDEMRPSKTQERDMLEAPPHFTLRVEQEHRKCEEDVSTRILKPESNVATENDIQIKNIAENKLLN